MSSSLNSPSSPIMTEIADKMFLELDLNDSVAAGAFLPFPHHYPYLPNHLERPGKEIPFDLYTKVRNCFVMRYAVLRCFARHFATIHTHREFDPLK